MNLNLAENFKDKVILVTGGAGFVGANLVRRLVEVGCKRIFVLDNLFTGRKEFLYGLKDIEFIQGSVEDYDLVSSLVKESDIVFHLAVRNIIVSTKEPAEDFRTNVYGTFNILEACRNYGIDRLVFTSSVSVYGNAKHLPIDEKDNLYPLNPYAASKISSESYCNAYYETYGVPVVILRYSNVYGPYQTPQNPYCGVVSKFISNALRGTPLQVHGDGEQTRDFTYVEDVVEANLLAAVNVKAVGETFNIASGIEVSVNKLAKLILKLTNSNSVIEYVDKRDIDNVRRRVLNIEQARKILRWSPKTTLLNGLEKTVEWMKEMNEI